MDANGGSMGFGISPSPSELFRECTLPFEPWAGDLLPTCGEPGFVVLPLSLLSGTLEAVAAALRDDKEDEERAPLEWIIRKRRSGGIERQVIAQGYGRYIIEEGVRKSLFTGSKSSYW